MTRYSSNGVKPESVADAVTEMKLESHDQKSRSPTDSVKEEGKSPPRSRSRSNDGSDVAAEEDGHGNRVALTVSVKAEPDRPLKLTRTPSHKVEHPQPPPLFDHLPDETKRAKMTFQVIDTCTYANKSLGFTEHAMDCDCSEEWDAVARKNRACGEVSDCINRATKMECSNDCSCGAGCANQRFQRREYAPVSVIKTDKKGYGLRADSELQPHQFVYEYIGEVINEAAFRRRMRQYDQDGIKHFYFMSLSKGEFVDATRKGNLGRFCNHSCNPNCYVDKWVVGDKLRMGIFAERRIRAGEELVFNYNVDRYGADPQPCYCGEPNCSGFIGGKTQTERATKLSLATLEALGIDDHDGWDVATKRPGRKKKGAATQEDEEEYVDSVQPKPLHEDGVTKVMAALMQCKEKWIAVKLLARIQGSGDERVGHRVVKMHGYQILRSQLATWHEDHTVVLQILDILEKLPRITRNKILDSHIESTIQSLVSCGDSTVETRAAALLEAWATLEIAYRIPRRAAGQQVAAVQFPRREENPTKQPTPSSSPSPSSSPARSPSAADAPRAPAALRSFANGSNGEGKLRFLGARPFRRPPPPPPLPAGWYIAEDHNGRPYYYTARGERTWTRPTTPAAVPKVETQSRDKALQDIINGIVNSSEQGRDSGKEGSAGTPEARHERKKGEHHKEKWQSFSEEKQKRLYENALFPHVKHIVDQFKHKLPKEDLKRYAKEVSKKLVNSDFKNGRVNNPTKVSDKQVRQVKKFCKDYFEKAVAKHRAYEQKKAAKRAAAAAAGRSEDSGGMSSIREQEKKNGSATATPEQNGSGSRDDDDEHMSDMEPDDDEPAVNHDSAHDNSSNSDLATRKRKRDGVDQAGSGGDTPVDGESPSAKRPPPPPPPPPGELGSEGESKGEGGGGGKCEGEVNGT